MNDNYLQNFNRARHLNPLVFTIDSIRPLEKETGPEYETRVKDHLKNIPTFRLDTTDHIRVQNIALDIQQQARETLDTNVMKKIEGVLLYSLSNPVTKWEYVQPYIDQVFQ